MKFALAILGYGTYPHARCFEDFARALGYALRDLGHEVGHPTTMPEGRLLLFGANNLIDVEGRMPQDAIIYNAEQLGAHDLVRASWLLQNFQQYRTRVVWDYSSLNIERLRGLGLEHPVLCPVGYHPSMETIVPGEEDIDVLFYGSVNAERRAIFHALEQAGLRFVHLFGVYGAERDVLIARSKVVLNLRFYQGGPFEIFRVSHLLANRRCVVTEAGGGDPALEAFARRACRYAEREEIVEACQELVANARARRAQAETGYEAFRQTSLVENARRAVEASTVVV